jgi:hypothetical protein
MTAATTAVHHGHLRRLLDPSPPHHRRPWPLLVPDLGRKGGDGEVPDLGRKGGNGEEREREVDGVAPRRAERHQRWRRRRAGGARSERGGGGGGSGGERGGGRARSKRGGGGGECGTEDGFGGAGGGIRWVLGWWEGVFAKVVRGVCKTTSKTNFRFFEWK